MSSHVLLGRDVLKSFGYRLTKSIEYDEAVRQILSVEVDCNSQVEQIYINPEISLGDRLAFKGSGVVNKLKKSTFWNFFWKSIQTF